jgi:hypothetical protein
MDQIIEDMYRLRNGLKNLHMAGMKMNELHPCRTLQFEVNDYLESEGM